MRTNSGRNEPSARTALPFTRSATVLLSTRTCSRRPPGSHIFSQGCTCKSGMLSMVCSRTLPGTGSGQRGLRPSRGRCHAGQTVS
eukprot:1929319-Pyramimonas_sp.AAC.1